MCVSMNASMCGWNAVCKCALHAVWTNVCDRGTDLLKQAVHGRNQEPEGSRFGDHLSYSSEILKHIPFMSNIWSPAKMADGTARPGGAWPPRSGLPWWGSNLSPLPKGQRHRAPPRCPSRAASRPAGQAHRTGESRCRFQAPPLQRDNQAPRACAAL